VECWQASRATAPPNSILYPSSKSNQQAKNWSTISSSSDFWLWKHSVGTYSSTWHQSHEYDETLREAEEFFDRSVRTWSEARNIRQWEYAHRRLLKISWPQDQTQSLARTVWARAVGKPQRASKSKVRTGCITCKTRHVKCDKRKPACKRCATSEIMPRIRRHDFPQEAKTHNYQNVNYSGAIRPRT
jgi:hypothetical protein